jgi:hypothetical protein
MAFGIDDALLFGGISALGGLGSAFMSGRPAGTQTQTNQQQVQLPQWVDNASQNVLQQGYDTAANLRQPTQLGVAPITQGGQSAINFLGQMAGYGQQGWQQAQQTAGRVANYDPTQGDVSKFLNPYQQASMDLLEQQRRMGLNQNADQAIRTGAFAGSRHGVTEGVTNAQTNLLAGQLGSQNYEKALQAALATQQLNLQGAGAQAQFLTGGQNAAIQGGTAALGGQMLLQQNQQQQFDAQKAYEDALRQQPIDSFQINLAALRGIPYGQTQTGSQTGPGPTSNPFLSGLGGTAATAGILGSLAQLGRGGWGGSSSGLPSGNPLNWPV